MNLLALLSAPGLLGQGAVALQGHRVMVSCCPWLPSTRAAVPDARITEGRGGGLCGACQVRMLRVQSRPEDVNVPGSL